MEHFEADDLVGRHHRHETQFDRERLPKLGVALEHFLVAAAVRVGDDGALADPARAGPAGGGVKLQHAVADRPVGPAVGDEFAAGQ